MWGKNGYTLWSFIPFYAVFLQDFFLHFTLFCYSLCLKNNSRKKYEICIFSFSCFLKCKAFVNLLTPKKLAPAESRCTFFFSCSFQFGPDRYLGQISMLRHLVKVLLCTFFSSFLFRPQLFSGSTFHTLKSPRSLVKLM